MANLFSAPAVGAAAFDDTFRRPGLVLAGTDEAGRGPLAGPVVAAAVILEPGRPYPGVTDSKKMTARARDAAFDLIAGTAVAWAWASASAAQVDAMGPLKAAMLAMKLAVGKLRPQPNFVLVDGNVKPPLGLSLQTVVKGDAKSLSIGAASVMAKVTRDRLMLDMHRLYPQYGFDRHKGYGTAAHLAALAQFGPSPCHRLSFRGVRPEAPHAR